MFILDQLITSVCSLKWYNWKHFQIECTQTLSTKGHTKFPGTRECCVYYFVFMFWFACFLVNEELVLNILSMLLDFLQGSRFGEANVDIKFHHVHSLVLDDNHRWKNRRANLRNQMETHCFFLIQQFLTSYQCDTLYLLNHDIPAHKFLNNV